MLVLEALLEAVELVHTCFVYTCFATALASILHSLVYTCVVTSNVAFRYKDAAVRVHILVRRGPSHTGET
jgi:hypothetical protein